MAFKKGVCANPNGRPVGSTKKFRFDVAAILKELDFNPFKKLVELANESPSPHVRFNATAELASYVAPKLKHIEHAADSEAPFTITLNMGPKKDD